MKKFFTLLSLCMVVMTTFTQRVSVPESGEKYYIVVGNQKVGYVTTNGDSEKLTAKAASLGDAEKQTWTCTKNADETWTFIVTVDGNTWTMYTNADERLAAGSGIGENFKAFKTIDYNDDPSTAFGAIRVLEKDGNAFVNIYSGQKLGNEYGPWTETDNGSKVYFIKAFEAEIPHWDFDFNTSRQGDNSTHYSIQFNRPVANSPTHGPTGLAGVTGNKLMLSVDKDTLIADSLMKGDVSFRYKVWHTIGLGADSKKIVLVNEAGQYVKYIDLATEMSGGNDMHKKNEADEWVCNGKSGGGKMTGVFMATTDPQELYIFESNQGNECCSIDDGNDKESQNFLNVWGNVGWHHFIDKWKVSDISNAPKLIPINEVLSDDEIAEMDAATDISNVRVQEKQADGYVYTPGGRVAAESLDSLTKGLYIVNGKKVVVK